MTENSPSTSASSSQSAFDKFANIQWDRDKVPLITGAIVGIIIGTILAKVILLMIASATKQSLSTTVLGALKGGMTAIITTTFTYFLINRFLRKRERESDKILMTHIAEAYDRLNDLSEDYKSPDDEEELGEFEETIIWLKDYTASDRASRRKATKEDLQNLLFELRGIPTLLQEALVQLEFIQMMFSRIYTLLGVSSPKVSLTVPSCLDELAFYIRTDIEVISYGANAYQELERIHNYAGQNKTYQDEIDEVLERIGNAVSCLYDSIDEDFEEFRDGKLKEFFEQIPDYAKTHFDEALADLRGYQEELSASQKS